jgi:hypothetical protein
LQGAFMDLALPAPPGAFAGERYNAVIGFGP